MKAYSVYFENNLNRSSCLYEDIQNCVDALNVEICESGKGSCFTVKGIPDCFNFAGDLRKSCIKDFQKYINIKINKYEIEE